MKQKTIRVGGYTEYRFTADDQAFEFYGYSYTDDNGNSVYEWQPTKYRLGVECVLMSKCSVSPNAIRQGGGIDSFYLVFDEPEGIGGNFNPAIKQFHGWRGTTNDVSRYAHGLREIIALAITKRGYVTVTVGPDLAPERD